jgi:signal peptidase I
MRALFLCSRAILIVAILLAGWKLGRQFNATTLVMGHSMEPTLHAGQVARLNRAVPADIQRGAIVLSTRRGQGLSIKRVIGLPNETVWFNRGEIFVNGRMLYEPYLLQCVTTFSWDCRTLMPKNDEFVLLGDNRLTSEDSRQYGVVPRQDIIGIIDIPGEAPELLDKPHYRITGKGVDFEQDGAFPENRIERLQGGRVNGS